MLGNQKKALMYCLAYGSNLHPFRLMQRVPSANAIGVVEMPGKQLAFHKRSRDRSGKCTFSDTADANGRMYGVLYEFDRTEKARLDRLEGLGSGYSEQLVAVPLNGQSYNAYAYVAASTHIDASLVPYHWYKEMVLLGARYHRLPPEYIAIIEAVESVADPGPQRAAENEAILANMRRMNAAQGC